MTEKEIRNRKILEDVEDIIKGYVDSDKEILVIKSKVKGQLDLIKKEIKSVNDAGNSLIIRFNPTSSIYPQDFKIEYEFIKEVYSK